MRLVKFFLFSALLLPHAFTKGIERCKASGNKKYYLNQENAPMCCECSKCKIDLQFPNADREPLCTGNSPNECAGNLANCVYEENFNGGPTLTIDPAFSSSSGKSNEINPSSTYYPATEPFTSPTPTINLGVPSSARKFNETNPSSTYYPPTEPFTSTLVIVIIIATLLISLLVIIILYTNHGVAQNTSCITDALCKIKNLCSTTEKENSGMLQESEVRLVEKGNPISNYCPNNRCDSIDADNSVSGPPEMCQVPFRDIPPESTDGEDHFISNFNESGRTDSPFLSLPIPQNDPSQTGCNINTGNNNISAVNAAGSAVVHIGTLIINNNTPNSAQATQPGSDGANCTPRVNENQIPLRQTRPMPTNRMDLATSLAAPYPGQETVTSHMLTTLSRNYSTSTKEPIENDADCPSQFSCQSQHRSLPYLGEESSASFSIAIPPESDSASELLY